MFHERTMGWRGRSGGAAWAVAIVLTLSAFGGVSLRAETIHVPGDYPTIQEAIDAAVDGDEVVIAPGTYPEAINLLGKAITVRGEAGAADTIIDGGGAVTSVVTCTSGEGPLTRLEGLTVTGGAGPIGAGMLTMGSSPTVVACIFRDNLGGGFGGGLANFFGSATVLTGCSFLDNDADLGGAVHNAADSTLTLTDCVLSGNTASRGGAVYSGPTTSLTLTRCTIDANQSSLSGGAVYSEGCTTTLNECTAQNNVAAGAGGVVAVVGGRLDVIGCSFVENVATGLGGSLSARDAECRVSCSSFVDGDGGAGGAIGSVEGCVELSSCIFTGNRGGSGGGLFLSECTVSVGDCIFTNHSASTGGAIWASAISGTIADTLIRDNWAHDSGGGYNGSGFSDALLLRCSFERNTSLHSGGGAVIGHGTRLVACTISASLAEDGSGLYLAGNDIRVLNCALYGNTANLSGGGIVVSQTSAPHLINCLFSGNASGVGGAVFNKRNSHGTYSNCTFAHNAASRGAAIFNDPDSLAELTNCIVYSNGDPGGGDEIEGSGLTTARYSNIEGGFTGMGNIDEEPRFVDPDGPDNTHGTMDDDLRLSSNSPAIDAADNTAVPKGISTDLDGNPRFVDDPCTLDTGNPDDTNPPVDMGAYEFQPPCPPDLDCNGAVDFGDILAILLAWGNKGGPEDLDGSGFVDFGDILIVRANWGPCP